MSDGRPVKNRGDIREIASRLLEAGRPWMNALEDDIARPHLIPQDVRNETVVKLRAMATRLDAAADKMTR